MVVRCFIQDEITLKKGWCPGIYCLMSKYKIVLPDYVCTFQQVEVSKERNSMFLKVQCYKHSFEDDFSYIVCEITYPPFIINPWFNVYLLFVSKFPIPAYGIFEKSDPQY